MILAYNIPDDVVGEVEYVDAVVVGRRCAKLGEVEDG